MEKIINILKEEPRLIEAKKAERIIFVGDTHGDLEVSQKVITDYLKPGNKIIFLGDYVDRGISSRENLDFLLKTKEKYPTNIYLLQGNHEGYPILEFSPAEFWESLDEQNYRKYSSIVEKLPLVVMTKDIIALHGALPEVESLSEINKIKPGEENWLRICWGDFVEKRGTSLGLDPFSNRPQFGKDYFFELMKRFKKKVLIRSHQSTAPRFMFDDRCLTIFTSAAYTRERAIAIADLKREIKTAKNLKVVKI